ncbi:hypothetical protein X566_15795 [Afipia sp. P52-10]|nr:hypothetical protein X566_15795 [Afipia sp. P52-10]
MVGCEGLQSCIVPHEIASDFATTLADLQHFATTSCKKPIIEALILVFPNS